MEVATRHEELVYWYTRYEDPNCIAVVELVTTIVDGDSGVQVRINIAQSGTGFRYCDRHS